MTQQLVDEVTEPLPNGAEIPTHPSYTTGRRIVKHLAIRDATTQHPLTATLHANEVSNLMLGHQMALHHLHAFAIRNNHLYHTRKLAEIVVECEDADQGVTPAT